MPGTKVRPESAEIPPAAGEFFIELGLSPAVARGVEAVGFDRPTEVQRRVIPPVLAGHDLIAASETGSGKTAAFVLPLLDMLDYNSPFIQALCLVPTRELCVQVAEAFRQLSTTVPLRLVEIYGGVGYAGQRRGLSQRPQVVVGTPGRVLDLMGGGELAFPRLRILILDEADRMLDMGFAPQIREVLRGVPKERQSLMFSATIPNEVTRLAAICMLDPVRIQVGERARPPALVTQECVEVMPGNKEAKLREIAASEPGSILIFTSTKVRADEVYRALRSQGHHVCVIHSNRNQQERQAALDGFRSGRFRIMVATDLASRGLDVENISLVINYDLPPNPEDYVHRIGRTGRALASGRALSFVTYRDVPSLRLIEKLIGRQFKNLGPAAKSISRRTTLKRKSR